MIGFAGLPREPSNVWQAEQTPVAIASPRARSGFPLLATCAVFDAGVGAGAPLPEAAAFAPPGCEGVAAAGGPDAAATALAAAALAAAPDAEGWAWAATPRTRAASIGPHARATAFMRFLDFDCKTR